MREREFVGFVSDEIDQATVVAGPAGVAGRVSKDDELGLTVFEDVIPQPLLDRMNAVIDATRDRWSEADGGSETRLAGSFADMLRCNNRFRLI